VQIVHIEIIIRIARYLCGSWASCSLSSSVYIDVIAVVISRDTCGLQKIYIWTQLAQIKHIKTVCWLHCLQSLNTKRFCRIHPPWTSQNCYAVVTCEIKVLQSSNLFQSSSTSVWNNFISARGNLPEVISKSFHRLIAAREYFPPCSLSLKEFWNNFRTTSPSAAEITLFHFQTWLHVK